ncbi:MAG: acyl-CoA dehydrogenase [Desulfobacterales bacterium]|nr:acyl-CoA dehydrogenase [Desulfobacterales bacterium]
MKTLIFPLILIAGALGLAYYRASIKSAFGATAVLLLLAIGSGAAFLWILIHIAVTAVLALLSITALRRQAVSKPLFRWYKRSLPVISNTEQEAIDAGTVWWDGELFSGNPDWRQLLHSGKPALTCEEQAFLDGPVENLCRMVDPWNVNFNQADVPEDVMAYIKQEKFLGMIIPKQYGGLELSAVAQSEVLSKLMATGGVVGNVVAVPNSLGPGELLLKYGTEQQKDLYLPKLAAGQEIPCFALTAPLAGSDATSIPDTGLVCRDKWNGREIIGMRLNFDKRYITLAPIATLVGLAFKLQDPDHLIGNQDHYGITCALLPKDTPGLEIGSRHLPVGDPFLNGPVRGKDVFVPLDYIIGGTDMAGKGWRMLVNCLSAGRAISLPSMSNSLAKTALAGAGAYARIRKQFNISISRMEGIQKPLARIAGLAYIINAARLHTAWAVDQGSKPSVPSAILKYHCTEMARTIINDAFDIHAGKTVMKGPKNYLSSAYESIPVAITVEGANIITRSLMIFGQGVVRCHPYILKEMQLVQQDPSPEVMEQFDRVLFDHMGFICTNGARAFVHALTGSYFIKAPVDSPTGRYFQHLTRLSAAFTLTADMAMLILQASLKRRQMLSARLGDLLSMLYLTSMVLKHYHDQDSPAEDLPVVEWACQYLLNRYQQAMQEIIQNFPNRLAALKLRWITFPLGARFNPPPDKLDVRVSNLIVRDTETRKRLLDGLYATPSALNPLGRLNALLSVADDMELLEERLASAVHSGQWKAGDAPDDVDAAEAAGILSGAEAGQLRDYRARVMDVIQVDEFPYGAFTRHCPPG